MFRGHDPLAALEAARCRVCGCSELSACAGGCWWVEADLCSACTPLYLGTRVERVEWCPVHLAPEPCPTCRSYIAAGL